MDSKAGKIIIAASGVVAAGAALWYIWKKFIDVDDEEEETQAVRLCQFFLNCRLPLPPRRRRRKLPTFVRFVCDDEG